MNSVGSHIPAGDPRLLDRIGRDFAARHGVVPLRRVGALTLVAARDMWARIDTVDYLEARLGPVAFMGLPAQAPSSSAR